MIMLTMIQVPAVHQMEVHPYLQQKDFNQWLKSKGIHVIQFSPLGNMNPFYRATGWAKDIANMERIIDNTVMQGIGRKYIRLLSKLLWLGASAMVVR